MKPDEDGGISHGFSNEAFHSVTVSEGRADIEGGKMGEKVAYGIYIGIQVKYYLKYYYIFSIIIQPYIMQGGEG